MPQSTLIRGSMGLLMSRWTSRDSPRCTVAWRMHQRDRRRARCISVRAARASRQLLSATHGFSRGCWRPHREQRHVGSARVGGFGAPTRLTIRITGARNSDRSMGLLQSTHVTMASTDAPSASHFSRVTRFCIAAPLMVRSSSGVEVIRPETLTRGGRSPGSASWFGRFNSRPALMPVPSMKLIVERWRDVVTVAANRHVTSADCFIAGGSLVVRCRGPTPYVVDCICGAHEAGDCFGAPAALVPPPAGYAQSWPQPAAFMNCIAASRSRSWSTSDRLARWT